MKRSYRRSRLYAQRPVYRVTCLKMTTSLISYTHNHVGSLAQLFMANVAFIIIL